MRLEHPKPFSKKLIYFLFIISCAWHGAQFSVVIIETSNQLCNCKKKLVNKNVSQIQMSIGL